MSAASLRLSRGVTAGKKSSRDEMGAREVDPAKQEPRRSSGLQACAESVHLFNTVTYFWYCTEV